MALPSARTRAAVSVSFHSSGERITSLTPLSACQLNETTLHDQKEVVLFSSVTEIKHLHLTKVPNVG